MGPMFVRSQPDPVLLSDIRVLHNLLVSESHHQRAVVRDYMAQVQQLITPNHRKIVTDWMLEVCQSEGLAPGVFLSSVLYLDTILSQLSLAPSRLQLLASTCLSLASKLASPRPLSLCRLVIATDCSVRLQELQDMEMVVLQRLTWDLPSSASDFLTLLLSQLSPHLMSSSLVTPKMLKIIEKPAETFLMLASTEYKFHNIKPSIMACAAILTSLEQIVVTVDDEIFQNLSDIVRISQNHLCRIVSELRVHVKEWKALIEPPPPYPGLLHSPEPPDQNQNHPLKRKLSDSQSSGFDSDLMDVV